MATFKDRHGKEWDIALDLATAWKIEEYDFQGHCPRITLIPPQEDLLTKQITDSKILFGMTWCMVQDQIADHNAKLLPISESLTPEQQADSLHNRQKNGQLPIGDELDFARRFDGPSITAMKKAVWEDLSNFFPEMATTLTALTERFSAVASQTNDRLTKEINIQLSDDRIREILDKGLAKALSEQEKKLLEEEQANQLPITAGETEFNRLPKTTALPPQIVSLL